MEASLPHAVFVTNQYKFTALDIKSIFNKIYKLFGPKSRYNFNFFGEYKGRHNLIFKVRNYGFLKTLKYF